MEELRGVIGDLEQLNRATERDFLAVGGKLVNFLDSSRLLHGEISRLAALAGGEEARNACDTLSRVGLYAEHLRLQARESSAALRTLGQAAERIARGFSTFGNIATSFRVTAILARMEAAHLSTSQQNLKNLADDVRSCSDGIQGRARQVLETAEEFRVRIESTLPAIERFHEVQSRDLPTLLKSVDADLEEFDRRKQESAEVSATLTHAQETVVSELGAIAGAIQFHDITRQQTEHVIAALQKLLSEHPTANLSASGASLIRLQKMQLQHAATAFEESTAKIGHDLEAIVIRVAEIATASGSGTRTGEEDSFWAAMSRRFEAVAKAVSELDILASGTRAVISDLHSTTAGLTTAVDEVRSIELQLSHISINAVISASHIGAQGNSLRVIADSIRELRQESASRTSDACLALDSIRDAIELLRTDREEAAADTTSGAVIGEQLNSSARNLELAQQSAVRSAAEIAVLASNLCADLRKSRANFTIGRRFAETMASCCRVLEQIAIASGHAESADEIQNIVNMTEERYTMRAERDVHRAAAGTAAPADEERDLEVEFF
jgi:hypothetical protein